MTGTSMVGRTNRDGCTDMRHVIRLTREIRGGGASRDVATERRAGIGQELGSYYFCYFLTERERSGDLAVDYMLA